MSSEPSFQIREGGKKAKSDQRRGAGERAFCGGTLTPDLTWLSLGSSHNLTFTLIEKYARFG